MAYKLDKTGEELQSFITQFTEKKITTISLSGDCFSNDENFIYIFSQGNVCRLFIIANITYFSGVKVVGTWDDTMTVPQSNNVYKEYIKIYSPGSDTVGCKICFYQDNNIYMKCFGTAEQWSQLNDSSILSLMAFHPTAYVTFGS